MSEKKDTIFRRLYYGVLKENPIVVLCLGLCPTLAVTTTAKNGLAMGIFTSIVLVLSNFFIALFRKLIPQVERVLAYVVIIATFTTLSQIFLQAYYPDLSEALGIFIPLTAVNTVIYDRAEKYAISHNAGLSLFDGIGMGIGFTLIITILGAIREILGIGTVFGYRLIPAGYTLSIAALAPGGFIILACIMAVANKIRGGRKS
ncbi:MAG: electron transport complex subunit RsxE [Lachnospiraceae bacterium]|nr:electron transport complex subunit RsxE [Lachnospiraceae bacterium]